MATLRLTYGKRILVRCFGNSSPYWSEYFITRKELIALYKLWDKKNLHDAYTNIIQSAPFDVHWYIITLIQHPEITTENIGFDRAGYITFD